MDFLSLCITALCSFGALFIIAKFIGHKQIAQLDFFDYITGITTSISAYAPCLKPANQRDHIPRAWGNHLVSTTADYMISKRNKQEGGLTDSIKPP